MEDNKTYAHYGDDTSDFFTIIEQITSQAKQLESVILCNIGFNQENIPWPDEEDSEISEAKQLDNIIPNLSIALEKCVNLRRLILSDIGLQANIEDDDLDQLADALENLKHLSHIGIYNLLKTQSENNTNLRFLNIVLRACSQISTLQFEDNDLTEWNDTLWKTMGKLFNNLQKLSHFSVKDELFSDECLEKFCKALNGIQHTALETFSIEWQECPTKKGMGMLGDSLSKISSLKNLNIGLFDDESFSDAICFLKKFKTLNSLSVFVSKISDDNLDLLRDTLIALNISEIVLRIEADFMEPEEYRAMINKLDKDPKWPAHDIETLTYETSSHHTPVKKTPPTKTTDIFSNTPGRTPKYLRDILATIKENTRKRQEPVLTPSPKPKHSILDNLSDLLSPELSHAQSTTSKKLIFEEIVHEDTLHDITINFIKQLSIEFQTSTEFVNAVNGIYPLIENLLEPITFKVMSSAVFYVEFPTETKEEKKARTNLARRLAHLQYEKAMLDDSHMGRVETQAKNLARSLAYQDREERSPTPIISRNKRKEEEVSAQPEERPVKKEKLIGFAADLSVITKKDKSLSETKTTQQHAADSLSASSEKDDSHSVVKTKICDESIGSDDFEQYLQIIFSNAKEEHIKPTLDVMIKLSTHAQQSKTKKDDINEFIQEVMRLKSGAQFVQHIGETLDHYTDRQKNSLLKNTGSGFYRFSNIFCRKHVNPKASENKAKRFSQYSNSTTEDLLIELYEAAQHCESPELGL